MGIMPSWRWHSQRRLSRFAGPDWTSQAPSGVATLLRRGNFRSVQDLRDQVLAFIAYFNRTMAKPFKWTYQGTPLHA
jgi:hypothetical protein